MIVTAPTTVVTYEAYDLQQVRAVILGDGLNLATMRATCGAGWLGWFTEGEVINPAPQPAITPAVSASPPSATCWGRWAVRYSDTPECTLDQSAPPVRMGEVVLVCRRQPGTDPGLAVEVFRLARAAFLAATSAVNLAYFVEGVAELRRPDGGWLANELTIPFTGVA